MSAGRMLGCRWRALSRDVACGTVGQVGLQPPQRSHEGEGQMTGISSNRQQTIENKADQRRKEIVARAAELFNERGYALTSMEDIANALGMAKPTLYHYFRSKEQILAAIHEEVSQVLRQRLKARELAALGPAQQLFEIIVDILELSETHPGHQRVWTEHARELSDAARAAREVRVQEYQSIIANCIEGGIREGVFRPVDVWLTTMQITGMATWAYVWFRSEPKRRARDVAHVFWGNLFTGLTAERTTSPAVPH
jgi:AcrR family transcriptional regulator